MSFRRLRPVAFALGALVAASVHAQDWGNIATISSTLGVNAGKLCVGEGLRATDIGCPTYAPSVASNGLLTTTSLASGGVSATNISATGNVSANKFIGDGSLLTGVTAAATDRVVSSTTSMVADGTTGYISVTQGGTNTAWFHPQLGLVTVGVSSTGGLSGTTGYFGGNVGIGTTAPAALLNVYAPGNSMGLFEGSSTNTAQYWSGSTLRLSNRDTTAGNYTGLGFTEATTLAAAYNVGFVGVQHIAHSASAPTADLVFGTTNGGALSERMRILAAGNVGIGTSAPAATLQVSGTFTVSNSSQVTSPSLYVTSPGGFVGIGTNNPGFALDVTTTASTAARFGSGTNGRYISIVPGTATIDYFGNAGATTGSYFHINRNNNGQHTIFAPDGTGRLGIGTSPNALPSATLHVSGTLLTTSWTGINFSSAGNVSPTAPLEVSGTISATALTVNGVAITSNGGATDRITSNTSSVYINGTNGYVSLTQNGGVTGWFDPTLGLQTIGISTTTNQNSFTTGYFSGNVGVGIAPNTSYALDSYSSGNTILRAVGNATDLRMNASSASGGLFGTYSNNSLVFMQNGTEAMRINTSRNVGVGTGSPFATLQVSGTFTVSNSTQTSTPSLYVTSPNGYVGIGTSTPTLPLNIATSSNYTVLGVSSSNTAGAAIDIHATGTGGRQWRLNSTANASSIGGGRFSIADITAGSQRLTIDSNGNIGIGATTPTAPLDVSGSIVSRAFDNGSGTSIDWSQGNSQYTGAGCGSMTFSNMQDGGTYTLGVKGTTSGTCSFTQSGLTFRMPGNHGATTGGAMTLYSFVRMGTDVFVAWVPGF